MAAVREATVAQVGDLQDDQMKAVKVGETDVLLSRLDGQFYAIGATCPHQGGPLAEGVLRGDHVMCPWHHSCFRLTTGELLEPPALDPVPRYTVRVDGTSVIVRVHDAQQDGTQQVSTGVRAAQIGAAGAARDTRVFAILGGGAAGYAAADLLRSEGFAGRVVLITREQDLPYDRTVLSKDFLAGTAQADSLPLRDEQYYADRGIETMRGREVGSVDPTQRLITFAGGESMTYSTLLLATGSEPHTLAGPGADLQNLFYLRSMADAKRIVERAGAVKEAVVIGASFIGMETAASLTTRGLHVTVVAPQSTPFEQTLGTQVGSTVRAIHAEKGVTFRLGRQVARLEGSGTVEAVVLDSGERLPAELVIAGLGVRPATSYLQGVPLLKDGSVLVDSTMLVTQGLYAAGDIATFPLHGTGELARVEHWRVAEQHGRTAARAMLGLSASYNEMPFFWTQQFDTPINYVGRSNGWNDIFIWGEISKREFVAFYIKDTRVAAASGIGRDRDMAAIEELLWTDRMPAPDTLRGKEQDLAALVERGR
jgi:NADPH-dependent 2,4-dienoyl-CoA reductase/sulfur reductase-like enzyme/nitrite reductase/ring-hydroxylating ferredoxin subunit